MRRFLLLPILFAAAVFGRPGPDTARNARVLPPGCRVDLRMGQQARPAPVLCDLTVDLPSPGYDLGKPAVQIDSKHKRIRIELRATPKPGDGAWPAVMTPMKATAPFGSIAKGRYIVEVHFAVGKDSPLQPLHVFLMDATAD